MTSWLKRDVILQALTEIGIASYAFDSTADQLQDALRQLDLMMGTWINRSIIFEPDPYPLSTDPTVGDLDEDTNAPAEALAPMYLNLAIRLAPSYGKVVLPSTRVEARRSYSTLLGNYSEPIEYGFGSFLLGAGNKNPVYPWRHANTIEEEEEEVAP